MSIKIKAPKPIEVELEGKKFTVGKITQHTLDKIGEVEGAVEQTAVLLDCNPEEIKDIDVRSLQTLLEQLMEEIVGPGANPPDPGENS